MRGSHDRASLPTEPGLGLGGGRRGLLGPPETQDPSEGEPSHPLELGQSVASERATDARASHFTSSARPRRASAVARTLRAQIKITPTSANPPANFTRW